MIKCLCRKDWANRWKDLCPFLFYKVFHQIVAVVARDILLNQMPEPIPNTH